MAQALKKNSDTGPPAISVVMSVYNGEAYLRAAIDSILKQTFKDFEFIIVDDGSSDKTLSIIRSYHDKRIILITRENKGLVISLNEGIQKARGRYIARQDADDVSLPERFARQVHYFEGNEGAVLCGTAFDEIDVDGKTIQSVVVPIDDRVIRQELSARSTFAHGSVMYRRDIALDAGGYSTKEFPAEDYGLWLRLADYGLLHNCPEALFRYRITVGSISRSKEKQQKKMTQLLQDNYCRHHSFSIFRQCKAWRLMVAQDPTGVYLWAHYRMLWDAAHRRKSSDRWKIMFIRLIIKIFKPCILLYYRPPSGAHR